MNMNSGLLARRAAAVLWLALAAASCRSADVVSPPSRTSAAFLVRADVTSTAVAIIVVEVTGPNVPTPLVFNIPINAGVASGTITIPPGIDRLIVMRAFDAQGIETDSGSTTMTVQAGANPPVSIVLNPIVGNTPINVTLGSFAIVVTPAVDTLLVGSTVDLSALVLDADGDTIADQVGWASLLPSVASVVSTGSQSARVTAIGEGQVNIVATYGGTAMLALIVVPTTSGGLWTHEPPGLNGIADVAGDRDHDWDAMDLTADETPSGWNEGDPDDSVLVKLISDNSAPFPAHVIQMTFPIGFSGGIAPGTLQWEHAPATEYYLAFYFKISNPYQSVEGGHNKIAYIYTPTRDLVLEFFPQGNNWRVFMAEYVSDSAGFEVDHAGTGTMVGGRWYKIEVRLSYANSRVTWWLDGAQDQDFACDFTNNAGGGIWALQFSPTYGGGGLPVKTETDYVWYDHVHLTGAP